jgi:cyclin-dependent kinase 7
VRELKLLQELRHPNIVRLLDVYVHKNDVNLVLEYLEGDLERVIRDGDLLLREEQVKHYMLMLLRGLEHCHRNWVLHRDIKPGNLLIAANGELKITDFGLAKVYGSPERNLSPQACTRWYRAPELLFGSRAYGAAADIWSAGCVFAELMIRVPLFSGDSDIDQLSKIFACLGTPRESDWPAMKELPDFLPFEPVPPTPLRAIFPAASADALDLLAQMLRFSPAARPSASDALRHRYFTAPPHPAPLDQMPRVRKRDAPVK